MFRFQFIAIFSRGNLDDYSNRLEMRNSGIETLKCHETSIKNPNLSCWKNYKKMQKKLRPIKIQRAGSTIQCESLLKFLTNIDSELFFVFKQKIIPPKITLFELIKEIS